MAIQLLSFLVLSVSLVACGKANTSSIYPPFGRKMRQEFFMASDFIQLNHGAYGTYPKVVSTALLEYQVRSERNPDLWMSRDAETELTLVRRLLAELIGAHHDDIVMIPNVTSGMNAILRSLILAFGERILYLSTAHRLVPALVQYIVDRSNGSVSKLVFNLTYPITNEDFLDKLDKFLNETHDPSKPIRVAVVDHVSAKPAIIIPIDKVVPMLKRRNITVVIDGAHAIGQVPINISSVDPDFYVTDCHKWLYAARGCGVLYVKREHQPSIYPAHISSGYPSNFQDEFFWTGTIDYSSYMTVPTALKFRNNVGGEQAIMDYIHNLAMEGGQLMASRLGTRILQQKNQLGSMVDIELRVNNPEDPRLHGQYWTDIQLDKYSNTYSPVYKHNGQWWIRVSAQIYNDISDFEVSAQHFLDICNELNLKSSKASNISSPA